MQELINFYFKIKMFYENIAKLVQISKLLLASNAEIERTFSSFSYLKNKTSK